MVCSGQTVPNHNCLDRFGFGLECLSSQNAFVTFLGVGQTRNRLHGPSNGKRNLQGIATKPSVGFTRAESRGTDEYVQVSLAFRWGFAWVSLAFRWGFAGVSFRFAKYHKPYNFNLSTSFVSQVQPCRNNREDQCFNSIQNICLLRILQSCLSCVYCT